MRCPSLDSDSDKSASSKKKETLSRIATGAAAIVTLLASYYAMKLMDNELQLSIEENKDMDDINSKMKSELRIPHEMEKACLEFRNTHEVFLSELESGNMERAELAFGNLEDCYNANIRDNISRFPGLGIVACEMQEAIIEYGGKIKEISGLQRAINFFKRGEDIMSGSRAVQHLRLREMGLRLATDNSASELRRMIDELEVIRNLPQDLYGSDIVMDDINTYIMLACERLLSIDPNADDRSVITEELGKCQCALLVNNVGNDELAQIARSVRDKDGIDKALNILRTGQVESFLAAVKLHGSGKVAEALKRYNEFDYERPLGCLAVTLAEIAKDQLKFENRHGVSAHE